MKKQMTAAEMGRKGGRNRAANLSAEERRAIAQQGVNARWNRTQPHVDHVLSGWEHWGLADHIQSRIQDVPDELRGEVWRRALREAIRRLSGAVAASRASSSIESGE